jgi:hypothetical protein
MHAARAGADPRSDARCGRADPDSEIAMEPSHQTRIFLMMALVSLLFIAQLTSQAGAFAALP